METRNSRYILLACRKNPMTEKSRGRALYSVRNITAKGREACVRRAFSDESVRANE